MSVTRRCAQLWFVARQTLRYAVRSRRVGILVVVVGGAVVALLTLVTQAVAPVVIYPML